MKKLQALIVYDSVYGNTHKIADAIADGIRYRIKVDTMKVADVSAESIMEYDLLVVGSPTHGGRPSQAVQDFLSSITPGGLKQTHVAAFDTRFSSEDHNVGLRFLMRMIGFAAEKIEKYLVDLGGTAMFSVSGYIVKGKEGPLKEGEVNRAREWGRSLSIYMLEYKQQELAV